ncbi:zinc ABC transporter substrate-binding protein AztC [Salinibacterium sp. SYSU T00001]|uniref:zinc ABC transporter substrate-binding protein AztC n=1 Tax=Homoserinimonas sedimenticola TaxID=2986805 RepID=UPI0022365F52|nr:zinc ABC transporter substrate-binding protein AztC [Salinibacterium sedimenticola]MCW4386301.1 zinc ABC transporter substrate-binding protein AztC [Salinibacterium sedimenticola]
MRRALTLLTLAVLGLTGCSAAGVADERPLIVATTNILGDVVGELVGDRAEVFTLMPPNADPHSFDVSPADAARMRDAELIVANGLGLEEGLQHHVEAAAADGVEVIEAGDLIEVLAYAEGGSAGTADPHFWTDPARMLDVVDGLEGPLSEIAGTLDSGYRAELVALDAELEEQFAAIPAERRALVTNHHVFGYLAERFDFRVIGAVVPSGTTLAAPSASDFSGLVSAIDEAGVPTIFADSSQPDRLVQVLAEEADRDVRVVALYTESLTEPGGGAATYLEMMRVNAHLITTGLSS